MACIKTCLCFHTHNEDYFHKLQYDICLHIKSISFQITASLSARWRSLENSAAKACYWKSSTKSKGTEFSKRCGMSKACVDSKLEEHLLSFLRSKSVDCHIHFHFWISRKHELYSGISDSFFSYYQACSHQQRKARISFVIFHGDRSR